ncbi:MAG: hypothetical protein ACF8XB_20585 [Planctomycetota bacterium JB042]
MSFSKLRLAASAAFVLSVPAAASEFATTVVQFTPGPGANASFPSSNVIGGPQGNGLGAGGLDVCVLGDGGSITLGFNVVIQDGPGADFMAYENGFVVGGGSSVFSEICHVEVSSDGVNFARFPSAYHAPTGTQMGSFAGLLGGMPVLANVNTNTIPPEDPVRAGGEAFDLAELAGDPLVVAGTVDLNAIQRVRLVDVLSGETDSNGVAIPGGGAADPDAVTVINHPGTVTSNQPVCDLSIDAAGFLELRLGDPNGFFDLDLAKLRASLNLVEFPFTVALPAFVPTAFDGDVYTLRTIAPVMNQGITGAFAVSVEDFAGGFSGDQVMIQG